MVVLSQAVASLRDTAEGAREQMSRSRDRLEMRIHRHPGQSLLAAAASSLIAGFGLGLLAGCRLAARNGHAERGRARS